jgi:hypothetical protein
LNASEPYTVPSRSSNDFEREVAAFWKRLRRVADKMQMMENIPSDFKMMNETKVSN